LEAGGGSKSNRDSKAPGRAAPRLAQPPDDFLNGVKRVRALKTRSSWYAPVPRSQQHPLVFRVFRKVLVTNTYVFPPAFCAAIRPVCWSDTIPSCVLARVLFLLKAAPC
jgi:hypothetical protein